MKIDIKMLSRSAGLLCLLAASLFGGTVQAFDCDAPDVASRLPALPNGCHGERITASGNQRPGFVWAQNSSFEHWRDQVISRYGERYAVPDKAACPRLECTPGSIAGLRRCTFAAFPCSASVVFSDELSRDEVREMQRLLTRKGYPTTADGLFGPKTQAALERWQKSSNYPVDGLPTMENLERLRQA